MVDSKLFLGVLLDEELEAELQKAPHYLRSSLLEEPGFLEKVEFQGEKYLGKLLGSEIDLESLALAEAHVNSLLTKILPDYPYKELLLRPMMHE